VKRIAIDSSAILAAGYDPGAHVLEIQFDCGIYDYHGVPEAVYWRFRRAHSKGRFVTAYIKGRYPFSQVRQRPFGKRGEEIFPPGLEL